jgi:dTDP-4-amino-4,6-dideoxy-D-galactose acyltransferase
MKRTELGKGLSDYEILKWETNFFGFTVARIVSSGLTLGRLKNILASLRERDVCLVCWASDSKDENSQKAAETLNGFLADRKMTYVINLKEVDSKDLKLSIAVKKYDQTTPTADLENLAIQSGKYSRFNIDPRISRKQFHDLYRLWIKDSTRRILADAVLIISETDKIVGMITVGEKNGRGDIGLIGVDPQKRGRQLGLALVKAAQSWFIARRYTIGQVVTQEKAIAARRVYEKCGYKIERVENFYHFWL